ncbi:MAG: SMC-Scp complex subunit ScpB [Ruminococcaceae bacterium]|nr:SMC-Scp complex subunit ScpB [Oscillospiraceae bacterium]
MKANEIIGEIEAVVFASGEIVPAEKIIEALDISEELYLEAEKLLLEKYNTPKSGINLLKIGGGLQFCSNPEYIKSIQKILSLKKNTPLSPAAMEVLALVAYNEPVTKAYVEQVRGVDCSGVISTLIQRELIEERGRLELPGRPLLYGITENFLRCFSLEDLSFLPKLPENETEENSIESEKISE